MMASKRLEMVTVAVAMLLAGLACNLTATLGAEDAGEVTTVAPTAGEATGSDSATEPAAATAEGSEAEGGRFGSEDFELVVTEFDVLLIDLDNAETKPILGPEDPVGNYQRAYWSPKGDWIALVAQMNQELDEAITGLYVVRPDGSELGRLGEGDLGQVNQVKWSPDGQRIAVAGADMDARWDLFLADPNTAEVERLTSGLNVDQVAWSPEGTHLVVSGFTGADNQLHLLSLDDPEDLQPLTSPPGSPGAVDWSPDGALLAYEYSPEGVLGSSYIEVIGRDGEGRTALTENEVEERHPRWSPNGGRIAFVREREEPTFTWDVVLINPDGSDEVILTAELLAEDQLPEGALAPVPAWSPDGAWLAVLGGDGNVYLLAADASELQTVELSLGSFARGLSWAPAP